MQYEEMQHRAKKTRKKRKQEKSHTGCLVVIGLFAVLLVAVLVVVTAVLKEVKGSEDRGAPVTVSVAQGSTSGAIAEQLKEAGLIKYPTLFRQYLKRTGRGGEMQYGDFVLLPGMGYDEIIDALSVYVAADTLSLTFPEGSTAVAIAQIMEDAGLCTAQAFLDEANYGDFSEFTFWSQKQAKPGCLMPCEGYLFPNTYEFLRQDTLHNYVATIYREFDNQMTPEMYDRMAALGMSLDDTVILASFIQEEAGIEEENAKVSAVFHNRLESTEPLWAEHKMESNACSYITNDGDNNYLWNSPMAVYMGWVEAGGIPDEVLAVYDTYRVGGLPAGAITNPGAGALRAALYPDEAFIQDGYYFFVTGNPDGAYPGQFFYGKTADEHAANCAKAGW